ncbi:MAG: leucine-rich repeat domain-containing protein [Ignavibacteria bacterium]|nr:leucine-rich repeat domain-containing protein [Ignavibacteria bacterium]
MKTTIAILLLLITSNFPLHANELGKRYLKLGNTYRESGNYEKSEEYLKLGKKMVAKDGYWTATAHEFLGYMYRDMVASGNYSDNAEYFNELAKENFENALAGFRKSVKQNDGSPAALSSIQTHIEELNSNLQSNNSSKSATNSVNYSNAKIVNYDNTKIKEVPAELPIQLENLSAVNNRIKEIPSTIAQYKKLKYLNLKKNRITAIAGAMSGLRNIKVLNLSENKLKSLPKSIDEMKQLEILDVSKNKLKEIPSSITSLKNLKVLDISGNKIPFSQISTLLKNMPNTNIIFDKYELVDEEESEDEDIGGPIQGN